MRYSVKSVFHKTMEVLAELWDLMHYIGRWIKKKISPKSLLTRFILIILIFFATSHLLWNYQRSKIS